MKPLFLFLACGLMNLTPGVALAAEYSYELRYDYVDAVVVRRLFIGLPQYDRTEILGTAELWIDGTSNALLGHYDVTGDVENEITKAEFAKCAELARKAMQLETGIIVQGKSDQPSGGGYKNSIFLQSAISCKLRIAK